MREWMREQMRKRSKRGPNTSESTGKIGQEIPSDQPKPLSPMYPEGRPARLAAANAAETEGNETDIPASFEGAGQEEAENGAADSGEAATPEAVGSVLENETPKHDDEMDAEGPELGGLEPEGRLEVETQPDSP